MTTKGKFISGNSPLEVLVSLKNSTRPDSKLELNDYLVLLMLRINLNYDIKIESRGYVQVLTDLEDIGFLLRLE
ncbi:hypothetical protein [Telluribacter sp. SYSU D00476]|uniref:hypothetical protein n=1 Tax=Telluribacter sp. SYSU D00476 TaxID=2811430 RepID=UPI001FF665BC|nr:hypothetical protein [Telluribacter sp. SYSU D00476]